MNALMAAVQDDRQCLSGDAYQWLVRNSNGRPIDELISRMLISMASGNGRMPMRFGFCEASFRDFAGYYFSPVSHDLLANYGEPPTQSRDDEIGELETLLMAHAEPADREAQWLARILAQGCMGSNHLWQDLGLWSRKDLTALLNYRFSGLVAKNTKDMKWKKFFYKQLCLQEGVYTCRAPSCEVCDDYEVCFGPE